jgi:hypothetical protein
MVYVIPNVGHKICMFNETNDEDKKIKKIKEKIKK